MITHAIGVYDSIINSLVEIPEASEAFHVTRGYASSITNLIRSFDSHEYFKHRCYHMGTIISGEYISYQLPCILLINLIGSPYIDVALVKTSPELPEKFTWCGSDDSTCITLSSTYMVARRWKRDQVFDIAEYVYGNHRRDRDKIRSIIRSTSIVRIEA